MVWVTYTALCVLQDQLALMKRSVAYGAVIFVWVAVWLYFKLSQNRFSDKVNWLTDVSPWYMLILVGCYCLAKLGMDLLSFNDYPHEIKKLEQV